MVHAKVTSWDLGLSPHLNNVYRLCVKSSQNSCVCGSAAFTSLLLCFGGVLLTSAQQKSCWGCYLPLEHFQQVPPSITKFSTRTGERLEHCFSSARHVCGITRTFLISPPGAPVSVWNLSSSLLCMSCWPPSPKAGSVVSLASVLGSGAPLPQLETLECPRQLTGVCRPMLMAELALMGWMEISVLREALGNGSDHSVSLVTCGCRQRWRAIRQDCHLRHGGFGAENQGSQCHLDQPVPGWSSQEAQVKGRIAMSLQLPDRSSGDFYCIGSYSSWGKWEFQFINFHHLRIQCVFSDLIVLL